MNEMPEFVRRRLRQQPAGDHPDADMLNAFAEQALRRDERERVLAHLAKCEACREVAALSAPPQETVDRAAAIRSSWLRWPVLRWGSLAAAAVIIVAAVIVTAPHRQLQQQPQTRSDAEPVARIEPALKQEAAQPAKAREQETTAAKVTAAPKPTPTAPTTAPQSSRAKIHAEETALAPKDASAIAQTEPGQPDVEAKNAAISELPAAAPPPRESKKPQVSSARVKGGQQILQAVPAQQAAPGRAGDALAQPRQSTDILQRKAVAGARAVAPGLLVRQSLPAMRWRVAENGGLERFTGDAWEPASVPAGVRFRVVSVVGPEVWAGGAGGALYHSSDAGRSWTRIEPRDGARALSADITYLQFVDARQGRLLTGTGETWQTTDGGSTWIRQ